MTVRVLVVLVVLLPSILARQLIDGGENAASGRWKYFVSSWTSTQAPENDDAACGGVLVAEDVVLTAASCLTQWGDEVKVSAWRLTSNTAGGAQILSIESVFYQHPEYRNTIDGGTIALDYGYDFMLFRIEPSGIDPIPLNFIADNPETGELGWIMGFGDANVGDDVFSTQLRQVQVDVTTEAICNTAANYDGEVDGDLQICAGTTSGEGACLNDEGGPLVGENGLLLGIFSTVDSCGTGTPGVYARITSGDPWIRSQTCLISRVKPSFCDSVESPTQRCYRAVKANCPCGFDTADCRESILARRCRSLSDTQIDKVRGWHENFCARLLATRSGIGVKACLRKVQRACTCHRISGRGRQCRKRTTRDKCRYQRALGKEIVKEYNIRCRNRYNGYQYSPLGGRARSHGFS